MRMVDRLCYAFLWLFFAALVSGFFALMTPRAQAWGARQGEVTAYTETP